MDTWEDVQREIAYEELYEEISQQAIEDHEEGRLRSFYLRNRGLAVAARTIFLEAEKLRPHSPSGALVLYIASIEVALKKAILEPVVSGLVHKESIAAFVTEAVIKQTGMDRFKKLLEVLLVEYLDQPLNELYLQGRSTNVWADYLSLQDARNKVVHQGKLCTAENAELAQRLAEFFSLQLVETIANRFTLNVDTAGMIQE